MPEISPGALAGVRVLEYGELVSAPYCGKLLADLGAEVVKVEAPGTGDPARRRGPFPGDIPHPERSGLFLYLNTNKLGITLNLAMATGRRIFRELAAQADVLIEDRPPGALDELGLGYQRLREVNPRLVVTSITPFGQTGPYRSLKAGCLGGHHASGQGHVMRPDSPFPERGPIKSGGLFADFCCGLSAATATLAALYWALGSGQGQQVDISKQEALMALERVELAKFPNNETSSAGQAVGGLMACADGYVVITAAEDHQWRALVELLGSPPWAAEERWQDEVIRSQHSPELNQRIEEWTSTRPMDEVYHRGQALGCPIGKVNSPEDLWNSPQYRARGFFQGVEHPQTGRLDYPSAPYQLSQTPWQVRRPAPLLGQHNLEILGQLGYTREQLVRLRGAGVI